MANFTVTKLGIDKEEFQEQVARFDVHCNDIISNINAMQTLIRSEDSNLADQLMLLANSYISYHGTIKSKFEELMGEIITYSDKSIKNEEVASQNLALINSSIDAIIRALQTIPSGI